MKFSFDWIASHRWAILPEMMRVFTKEALLSFDENSKIETLTIRDGEIPQWSYRTEMFNSVAVIPIIGPLYSKGSYYYGGSSISLIAKDFQSAIEDSAVSAIVLNVNSPGGEITGVGELADIIFNSRGIKPIITYVHGMCASAALWIGSSADKMIIASTGEAGSIGVVSVHYDTKELDKRIGYKEIEIVSSQSPKKRLDVTTPEGKSEVQRIVDELADVFVSAVARNRNVSAETVTQNFGEGSVLIGQSAVNAGLADEIGSLESVLKSLNVNKQTLSIGGFPMNLEELKAKHPETYNAALAIGKQSGVDEGKTTTETALKNATVAASKNEQDRILGILSLGSIPGAKVIVEAAVKDASATKETVALQIVQAQQKGTQTFEAAMEDDNTSLLNNLQKIESSAPGGKNKELTAEELGRRIAKAAEGIKVEDIDK